MEARRKQETDLYIAGSDESDWIFTEMPWIKISQCRDGVPREI